MLSENKCHIEKFGLPVLSEAFVEFSTYMCKALVFLNFEFNMHNYLTFYPSEAILQKKNRDYMVVKPQQ